MKLIDKLRQIPKPVRAYIYRTLVAIMALAVLKGIITKDELPLYLEVILSLLGLGGAGLATANTSTKK